MPDLSCRMIQPVRPYRSCAKNMKNCRRRRQCQKEEFLKRNQGSRSSRLKHGGFSTLCHPDRFVFRTVALFRRWTDAARIGRSLLIDRCGIHRNVSCSLLTRRTESGRESRNNPILLRLINGRCPSGSFLCCQSLNIVNKVFSRESYSRT